MGRWKDHEDEKILRGEYPELTIPSNVLSQLKRKKRMRDRYRRSQDPFYGIENVDIIDDTEKDQI